MPDIEKRKTNGQFAKGNAGKPQGAANRLTKELKAELKNLVFEEIEFLRANLDKMPPILRAEFLIKLIPYVIPKPQPETSTAGEPWEMFTME